MLMQKITKKINFFQKPAFLYWLCIEAGVIMVSVQDMLASGSPYDPVAKTNTKGVTYEEHIGSKNLIGIADFYYVDGFLAPERLCR